jgi:hypothetical protein
MTPYEEPTRTERREDPRSRWRNKPRMRLPTKGLLREQPEFGGNHKAAAGEN